ncbi:type II and III secretion system protein family protein [Lichenicoccus roseus]|uniref:Type II and III secretion system protein family protein n=1 Tax=Lichenicoccus roseus TaxID=2683649 RepID=A0A5R9J1N8_9PROT|nr:type II and III secretion system protein family protein [Lichenicoccus roseus]TLU70869.1 type II and III secretion system protein family protein [Lichenicoccus roseus]
MDLRNETIRRGVAAAVGLVATGMLARPAAADPLDLAPARHDGSGNMAMPSDQGGQPGQHSISIEAGTGRVMAIAGIAANVFVADPKILQVRPASASALFVFGLIPGRTTVAALDASGHPVGQYEITVVPGSFGAASAQAAITRALPNAHLTLTPSPTGVTISGDVATSADAQEALDIARSYVSAGQTVNNQMNVASSVTVGLKVRITEMDRQVTRELGIDWQAMGQIGKYAISFATSNGVAPTLTGLFSGRHLTVDTVLEALSQDNLVRVLAEPNLTARSGESASFLVGGEYPVPVAQGGSSSNAITITYQQYGVSLSFVPTVLSSGRISLHVRPEVSALATTAANGAVTLSQGSGSLQIPALTVRRAETTLELGSGQSFAIAGLLQDNTTQANNALPGLGDVPVLGALFRSDSYTHNQTELVIIVTPYIVGSVNDPDALQTPGARYKPPNDIERVLLLRQRGGSSDVTVPGDAGFVVQ